MIRVIHHPFSRFIIAIKRSRTVLGKVDVKEKHPREFCDFPAVQPVMNSPSVALMAVVVCLDVFMYTTVPSNVEHKPPIDLRWKILNLA